MIRRVVTEALRGISHPNTDLDAQAFLLKVRQIRAEAGIETEFPVSYRPQPTADELADSQVLVWDVGRSHDPVFGNFDHHQDHRLGATPVILAQALGMALTPLDQYVDLADRGILLKEPQPYPYTETLQGVASGISLLHGRDDYRSRHFQALLAWVEESGADPFGRFSPNRLPAPFRLFQEARQTEDRVAEAAASDARWFDTPIGPIAFVESDAASVMRVLYAQGAALVILHERSGHMSGWSRPAPKFTVGANPAAVAVPDRLDLRPLFVTLSTLEPSGHTWGGQAGIGGSPREEGGSGLQADQVIRAVREYL